MQYKLNDAVFAMNQWGAVNKPFLFIIDFEMKKIRLFSDEELSRENIYFSLTDFSNKPCPKTSLNALKLNLDPIDFKTYKNGFDRVMKHIIHGDSYLLNLTFPTRIKNELDLIDVYCSSYARYKLFYKNEFIVFSPETFVEIRDGLIRSFPMKGTIDASLPNAMEVLKNDPKEKAEHYTIVDLIRNDLGIVANKVKVKKFRYVDKLVTNNKVLYQTSSEIEGELNPDWHHSLGSILFALLPAGSVSGAPKQKTIEIIREAELDDRGYYTGIFGYFDGINLNSAVMIRYIERRGKDLFYRSGGGITSQSDAQSEYNELMDKVYVPTI